MKKTVVLLSFLLVGVIAICGASNNAFAQWSWSPPSPEAAVLMCSVSSQTFTVTAVSNTTSAPITAGEDCAKALAALESAGIVIRDIQVLNTNPPSVLYTLVKAGF